MSVCVQRLSYSRWKASAVRTGSTLERSSKISFDKWRLYHALDRSSGGKKNTWMEKREDFLAIAVLKRGQGEKRCTRFFSLTLSQKLPVLFSAQTHTDCKHNIHIIDATEREHLRQHITHTHSSVSVWDTKMKLPSTYEVQTLSWVEFPRRHFCRRT